MVMLASIWLQVLGKEHAILEALIADLAARYGTVPFQPHLTVCGANTRGVWDAAAEYIAARRLVRLRVTKTGISASATDPFKAVVIDVANTPELAGFRDNLRRITGAGAYEPPHISLFYPIDAHGQPVSWASDRARLRAIAAECATRLDASNFVLGHAVVVASDLAWTNITSWKVARRL